MAALPSMSTTTTTRRTSSAMLLRLFLLGSLVGAAILVARGLLAATMLQTMSIANGNNMEASSAVGILPPPVACKQQQGQQQEQQEQQQQQRDDKQRVGNVATAQDIVEQAFRSSFRHLTSTCTNSTPIKECCQRRLYPSMPWWFQTMMRDFRWSAPWHTQSANNVIRTNNTSTAAAADGTNGTRVASTNHYGPVQMCAMEKVGIKHWKELFCQFQNKTNGYGTLPPCYPNPKVPKTAPKFVFLRDPLERYLSAFIDKCEDDRKHCQPTQVFFNIKNSQNVLLDRLKNDKKLFFEAYVYAMPLKWDIHFFPQSLYCEGLYRTIDSYDFVGKMDSNFYNDLQQLGQRYGDKFTAVMDKVFFKPSPRRKFKKASSLNSNKTNNKGIETAASSRVLEYYNARTVKRVLEYTAIDYALLGIPIPTWAEQLLLTDDDDDATARDANTTSTPS